MCNLWATDGHADSRFLTFSCSPLYTVYMVDIGLDATSTFFISVAAAAAASTCDAIKAQKNCSMVPFFGSTYFSRSEHSD
jgi:hypothetical protein